MRTLVVLLVISFVSNTALAQSKVDQVPASSSATDVPLSPSPSDEVGNQPPAAHPLPEFVPEPKEPDSHLVPAGPADDTISRRLLLSVGTGYTSFFGHLDSRTSVPSRLSGGGQFFVDIGYGVSRYVELELDGSYAFLGNAAECSSCRGKVYEAVGAIRYHLVQGVRFDPWVRTGLGLSAFQLEQNQRTSHYLGLHWLELSLGGDWYFGRNFGFGPLLAISLASYLDHPSDSSTSVAARWLAGVNLTFDSVGK